MSRGSRPTTTSRDRISTTTCERRASPRRTISSAAFTAAAMLATASSATSCGSTPRARPDEQGESARRLCGRRHTGHHRSDAVHGHLEDLLTRCRSRNDSSSSTTTSASSKTDPMTSNQGYETKQNNFQPQHTTKPGMAGDQGQLAGVVGAGRGAGAQHVTQNIADTHQPEMVDVFTTCTSGLNNGAEQHRRSTIGRGRRERL